MATDRPNPPFGEPLPGEGISTSGAGFERWPEGSRGRERLAPETTFQQPPPYTSEPPEVFAEHTRDGTVIRAARATGGMLGTAVRYARSLRGAEAHREFGGREFSSGESSRQEAISGLKDFVQRHPSSLIGAGVAGFFTGRMLRRR